MPLDQQTIDALLNKQLEKGTGTKTNPNAHPRSLQLGPLKWAEESKPCTSRGCGSPTMIRVRGIPYCTSHALQVLNQIILTELQHYDLSRCTCKPGVLSRGNIHNADCDMYQIAMTPVVPPDNDIVDLENLL